MRLWVGGGAQAEQQVESEVAAAFGPLVMLLGQDGADQADDRGPIGEDPDHVGASADLSVHLSLGLLDQIWRHTS